jgi:hypothetical protein
MGCNCWGDNSRSIKPNRHTVPSPSRPLPPPPPGPARAVPPQALKKEEFQTERKCARCGHFVKKVRYIDPTANIVVEKYLCTNQACPNFNC